MITTLTYGGSFELIITTIHGNFSHEIKHCSLQDAINYCEMIFDDATPIYSQAVSLILVCDTYTGEICAECRPDPVSDESPFDNPHCCPEF